MPEGDSIHSIARRMREKFEGKPLQRLGGSEPSVRTRASSLRGTTIERVEAIGKHLVVEFEGGWALRVHLGMTGRWRFGPPTGVRGDGPARVALESSTWSARCYGAPTVEIDRTPRIHDAIAYLGPDLTEAEPELGEALHRARETSDTRSITDTLLDQSIVSGIGNVYRNEILFEAGVHPLIATSQIDDEQLVWMFDRVSRLLRVNVGRRRSTTGGRRPGTTHYVYERSGKPCRRCGDEIQFDRTGQHDRTTFWCPTCQPALD